MILRSESVLKDVTPKEVFDCIYYEDVRTSWDTFLRSFKVV